MSRSLRFVLPSLAAPGCGPPRPGPSSARTPVRSLAADVQLEDIRASPIPGTRSARAEVGYASADGRHYIDGDLFDMQTRDNLTEKRRRQGRLAPLASVGDEAAIELRRPGRRAMS